MRIVRTTLREVFLGWFEYSFYGRRRSRAEALTACATKHDSRIKAKMFFWWLSLAQCSEAIRRARALDLMASHALRLQQLKDRKHARAAVRLQTDGFQGWLDQTRLIRSARREALRRGSRRDRALRRVLARAWKRVAGELRVEFQVNARARDFRIVHIVRPAFFSWAAFTQRARCGEGRGSSTSLSKGEGARAAAHQKKGLN